MVTDREMEEKRKKVPRAQIRKALLRLNNMLLAVRVDRSFTCVFPVGLDDASCMPFGWSPTVWAKRGCLFWR